MTQPTSDIIEEAKAALGIQPTHLRITLSVKKIDAELNDLAQRILEAARQDTPIEHCGEKDCPECNLAAFEAGKKEGYEKGFVEGQKHAFGVDRERVKKEGAGEERERCLKIITDEITLTHTSERGKTSGLTSAYNRITLDNN